MVWYQQQLSTFSPIRACTNTAPSAFKMMYSSSLDVLLGEFSIETEILLYLLLAHVLLISLATITSTAKQQYTPIIPA
jgi:hypothetical protein